VCSFGFDVFLALDFNGDEFMCAVFWYTMVGGTQRETFYWVDQV
jgi:hypothetical protein